MSSGSSPQWAATASGGNSDASARTRCTPVTRSASPPSSGSTRSSSKSVWTTAKSSAASVPGRGATCRSASSAVRVRVGSITVSLPPRRLSALSLPPKSAAVATLPLDTSGLAPMITRWSVRSMSGTVNANGLPYM